MLHERRRCTTDERVGMHLAYNPINGSAVPFSKVFFEANAPYVDPLAAALVQREVISDEANVLALLNIANYNACDTVYNQYHGNLHSPPPSGSLQRYLDELAPRGPLLTNVVSLFSGRWDKFRSSLVDTYSVSGEKPVVHENLFGGVSSLGKYGLVRQTDHTDGGFNYYADIPSSPKAISFTSFDPIIWDLVDYETMNPPIGRLSSFLANLDLDDYSSSSGNISRYYPLMQWRGDELGKFTLAYRYGVEYRNTGTNKRYLNWFTIRFTWDTNPQPLPVPELAESVPFSDVFQTSLLIEWAPLMCLWCTPISNPSYAYLVDSYTEYPGYFTGGLFDDLQGDGYSSESVTPTTILATNFGGSRISDVLGYSHLENRYTTSGDNTFLRFCRDSKSVVKEAIPALALPFADAMEKQFNYMSSNHLEALMELSDVLAPIDTLKLAKAIPGYVSKKGALIVKILDLLADAKLVWSFGIAPTFDDAVDVSKKAKAFKHRLLSGVAFKEHTTYGKTVVVLDENNELGVPPCTVVLRSKVRTREIVDSLLTAAITADSLGLLPQFSTLWDIVPWSFAVDWFAKVGDGLSIVDNQAKMLALDCQLVVHSITVYQNFDDSMLNPLGFSIDEESSSDGVGYKTYFRSVSRTCPVFGPTRLPVTSQPGIPDWGVAGSLVFKQLK